MFKFHFGQVLDIPLDQDEMEDVETGGGLEGRSIGGDSEMQIEDEIVIGAPQEAENEKKVVQDLCQDVPLDDLVKTLPSVISYTPLIIKPPSSNSSGDSSEEKNQGPIVLLRRDLYDARYQLISDASFDGTDATDEETDDESFGNANSDTDTDIDSDQAMEDDRGEVEDPIVVTEQLQEHGDDVAVVDAEDNGLVPLPPPPPENPDNLESSRNRKPRKRSRRWSHSQSSQKKPRKQQPRLKLGIHDLEYIDAPSDVIPNVYEGGLKTWECSIDLVEHLNASVDYNPRSLRGKSVLEVGAGTAMPSIFILQSLLNEDPPVPPSPAPAAPALPPTPTSNTSVPPDTQIQSRKKTVIHLQDYNRSVLELVTVPNLLLAWYSSSSSAAYRQAHSLPPLDASSTAEATPGDMNIDTDFVAAFKESLDAHGITIRLSAGSWSTFQEQLLPPSLSELESVVTPTIESMSTPISSSHRPPPPYDLVITSETIYRSANVPSLLSVLSNATRTDDTETAVKVPEQNLFASIISRLNPLSPNPGSNSNEGTGTSTILVAAKVLYFGVGGSVDEFESMATATGAKVMTVHEMNIGVGRKIMKVQFP